MPPTEMPQSTPSTQPQKKGGMGPLFGIVIILVLILAGAFYFWGKALNSQEQNPPPYIPGDTATS